MLFHFSLDAGAEPQRNFTETEKYVEFDKETPENNLAPMPKPVTVKGRVYTLDDI